MKLLLIASYLFLFLFQKEILANCNTKGENCVGVDCKKYCRLDAAFNEFLPSACLKYGNYLTSLVTPAIKAVDKKSEELFAKFNDEHGPGSIASENEMQSTQNKIKPLKDYLAMLRYTRAWSFHKGCFNEYKTQGTEQEQIAVAHNCVEKAELFFQCFDQNPHFKPICPGTDHPLLDSKNAFLEACDSNVNSNDRLDFCNLMGDKFEKKFVSIKDAHEPSDNRYFYGAQPQFLEIALEGYDKSCKKGQARSCSKVTDIKTQLDALK